MFLMPHFKFLINICVVYPVKQPTSSVRDGENKAVIEWSQMNLSGTDSGMSY